MLRRLNTDALIAVLLLVACAELFRQTFHFRVPPFATMDSAVWPRLIIGSLAILCLVYLIQSFRPAAPDADAEKTTDAKPFSHRNAIICFILFVLFAATLPYLGMLLGGMAFVFLMQELMGPRDMRSRLTHLAVAAISVGGMWAVFTFALRVILPEGILLPGF
ncbi:MAG: tripartite tricarboxylate transporter TctB family protein [Methyloceanibacter sp.]